MNITNSLIQLFYNSFINLFTQIFLSIQNLINRTGTIYEDFFISYFSQYAKYGIMIPVLMIIITGLTISILYITMGIMKPVDEAA